MSDCEDCANFRPKHDAAVVRTLRTDDIARLRDWLRKHDNDVRICADGAIECGYCEGVRF